MEVARNMHWSRRHYLIVVAGSMLILALVGCGSNGDESDSQTEASSSQQSSALPQGSEPANLDPAEFTTKIDNPYWPLAPGSRWVYREVENGVVQRVDVTVTDRTKVVDGVTARVVYDVVSTGGQPIERTFDWYAQDSAGNVWYMGEDTKEYENGKVVSKAGSWEAGVGGAEAGVIMPAQPQVGQTYRQEYDAGNAEDYARVISLDEKAKVPFGSFTGGLKTKDVNPLDKNFVEHKYYAKGVGSIETIQVSGGSAHEQLISYQR
jgi:hypothetical protein